MSKHQVLVTGAHVRYRLLQMWLWTAIAAVLGAGFIAGLYYGAFEMRWFVHIGPVQWNGFTLKHWWDNLFSSKEWPTYRHSAFRDIAEPAIATMAVLTLLVKPKWWERQVGTVRLLVSPAVLILATFALGVLGTWLLDFMLPNAISHWALKASAANLILGFIIGKILHRFWAPVGATYQGRILAEKVGRSHRHDTIPLWVRYPLAPPVLRERFSKLWWEREDEDDLPALDTRHYWLIMLAVLAFVLITTIGLIAHYWIGAGHTFPYLNP